MRVTSLRELVLVLGLEIDSKSCKCFDGELFVVLSKRLNKVYQREEHDVNREKIVPCLWKVCGFFECV